MVSQKQVEYQRRYLAKNRDKINARRRERRKLPENIAKEKEYAQRPEVKARRAAAARIHNKTPEAQAYKREWRRKNPEKSKEYYERNKEENQRKGRERKQTLRSAALIT